MTVRLVDAHVHLWDLDRHGLSWFRADLGLPRRALGSDLRAAAGAAALVGVGVPLERAVAVQAGDADDEVLWLRAQRQGIVGSVVLQYVPEDPGRLDAATAVPGVPVRGVRVAVPGRAEDLGDVPGLDALMGRAAELGVVVEFLVRWEQLAAVALLAATHPRTSVVVCHLGLGARAPVEGWARGLARLAAQPNAAAKVSGLVRAAAETLAAEFAETLAQAERQLERLTADLADWNARKASLERGRAVAGALIESSKSQLGDAQVRLDRAMEAAKDAPDVHAAEAETERARTASQEARAAAAAARAARANAEAAEAAAREPLEAAEREAQRLSAETKALSELLHPEGEGLFPPLVDAVTVQTGYEAALAAALGEDLQAPLDDSSPHHWRDLGAFESGASLPEGCKPLGEFVQAPAALNRRLAMTGLIFPDQGAALQKQLKPGQCLVSPRGDVWRWDGFVASADAPSPSAIRLAQRNHLVQLEDEAATAREIRAARFAEYSAARDGANAAREALHAADSAERDAEQTLIGAQDLAARAARAAAERASQLASLEAEIRRLAQSVEAAEESHSQAVAGLEELGDGVTLNQSVANARGTTADARTASSVGEAKPASQAWSRRRAGFSIQR